MDETAADPKTPTREEQEKLEAKPPQLQEIATDLTNLSRIKCSWKKKCTNAAQYCDSMSSKRPKCCELCKQDGSVNIDFYDLKNRGGFLSAMRNW